MKVLVCHPGQTFSTSDVFDGMVAGLEACGVEVVRFEWSKMLQILGTLIIGSVASGVILREKASQLQAWASWLAAADSIAVALDSEVDAVLIINGLLFPPERAQLLQQLGIPVACYGTEAPYTLDAELQFAPYYSHWFTQERTAVPAFQGAVAGGRAFYLPMAYNPAVHRPEAPDPERACDVSFVGGGFPERRALLEGVDWTGIDRRVLGTLWHLDLDAEREEEGPERAVRYAEGAIPNGETAAWHRSARIALNIHRTMTRIETPHVLAPKGAESLGPRAYEIPASGGFMLCDDERPEVFDVFGEAAATYRAWDSADLERQVRYWLAHPDERERRRQAQAEAVRPHTWAARAATVLETIFA